MSTTKPCFPTLLLAGALLALPLTPAGRVRADSAPGGAPAGFPGAELSRRAREAAQLQRAVTAYRFWYPTVSMEALIRGSRAAGMRDNRSMLLMIGTPQLEMLTANSDTPYAIGVLDLRDGPMVVELPAGRFMAFVNDRHQRWIMDMGLTGPDAGKGGRHLILPPGFKGKPPAGYHVGRATTRTVVLAIRAIPESSDLRPAMAAVRTVKVHPLGNPSQPLSYLERSGAAIQTTAVPWEDNLRFWQTLHETLRHDLVPQAYRPMQGLLLALGITDDRPFPADQHLRSLLERAAREGQRQMLVSAFDSDRPDRLAWQDRRWEWVVMTPENVFFETPSGMDLEARDSAFMQAIGTSPVMFRRRPGIGSTYWRASRDSSGRWLEGGRTYRLTVPLPVPARLFWSVTVYDPQTRSEIRTAQNRAALRSLVELAPAKIGRNVREVDLYVGPTAPPGKEDRWIRTTPGRGWFAYFRIYGLEQATFDGSWRPGDFVALE
jgi:hypothetical protein